MRTVEAAGLPIGDDHPPRIMGVLNLSPESPYDPSVFDDPAEAAAYADGLIEAGADVVDVGLESANKRFEVRDAEWELDRLDLAVETIERVDGEAVFSLETRYADVAAAGLDAGFDMVNDIAGFADPRMPEVCEERGAAVVKMAGPGDVARPGALESVEDIYDALAGRLTERTIVDPAFGGWSEAKTLADDRETFRRLREFRGLDRPILVSINRKNFLRELAGRSTEAALPVSLAATSMAVERGAHVVRTHDVAETRDAAIVGHAFDRDRSRGERARELDVTGPAELGRHADRLGVSVDAASGTATAVEVSRLDGQAEALRAAAGEAGAVAALDGGRGLVAGTDASLRRLADALDGTALDDVAAVLAGAVE